MYDAIDALILASISVLLKNATFHFIYTGSVREEAERLVTGTKREPFRVVDARLQALRRKDTIFYQDGYWHLGHSTAKK